MDAENQQETPSNEYTLLARAFLNTAFEMEHATNGLERSELATRAGISERQLRAYMGLKQPDPKDFYRWFRICNELNPPHWAYFRSVLEKVRNLPLPFKSVADKAKDSPEYKAYLQCLALKEVVHRGLKDNGLTVAQASRSARVDAKRLGRIANLEEPTLPTWSEWLKLCETLKFPQWEPFCVFLKEETRKRVVKEDPVLKEASNPE